MGLTAGTTGSAISSETASSDMRRAFVRAIIMVGEVKAQAAVKVADRIASFIVLVVFGGDAARYPAVSI
jgi:hypothetical protein